MSEEADRSSEERAIEMFKVKKLITKCVTMLTSLSSI
jgi:hypothetical protein